MQKFSNLNDLFTAAGSHQITLQELLNNRTFVHGNWQDIEITPELKQEIIIDICQMLGGRQKSKEVIKNSLMYGNPQHWGLRRFLLSKYTNNAVFNYCAGQDYVWEMQAIRNYLKAL